MKAPLSTTKRTGTSFLPAAKAANFTIRQSKSKIRPTVVLQLPHPPLGIYVIDPTGELKADWWPWIKICSRSTSHIYSWNRPAADAVPDVTDESYMLLSRSFHYAANIFAQVTAGQRKQKNIMQINTDSSKSFSRHTKPKCLSCGIA